MSPRHITPAQRLQIPGTVHGPVRHGEDTHPSDRGLRSVTSLLVQLRGEYADTDATRSVFRREKVRVSPWLGDTARLPRLILTASAPLGARA